jgi:hypothetical protein
MLGRYGGGVLRGARRALTHLAGDGLQLLNYLLEREVADDVLSGSRSRGPEASLARVLRPG